MCHENIPVGSVENLVWGADQMHFIGCSGGGFVIQSSLVGLMCCGNGFKAKLDSKNTIRVVEEFNEDVFVEDIDIFR